MKTFLRICSFFFIILSLHHNAAAQVWQASAPSWYTMPTAVNCSTGCTFTLSSLNTNINSGQTACYTALSGSLSNVNLGSGGTLRVCGNLTLSNFSYNGGTIVVVAGGTLTINGDLNMNGGGQILNYGTLNMNGHLRLQASMNRIINGVGATFNMLHSGGTAATNSGSWYRLELNSGTNYFTNYGTARINFLLVQGGTGGVALGLNSNMTLQDITNNMLNSFIAPFGQACIAYTNHTYLNQHFTTTSNIRVCRANGSATTFTNSATWGAALVTTNCNSCLTVLPVKMAYFNATLSGKVALLKWATTMEDRNDRFEIEKSTDGNTWKKIGTLKGKMYANSLTEYSFTDANPEEGMNYYRLKQVDMDKQSMYSTIASVKSYNKTAAVVVTSATQNNSVINISGVSALSECQLSMMNMNGKVVYQSNTVSDKMTLPKQTPGIYVVKIENLKTGACTYTKVTN